MAKRARDTKGRFSKPVDPRLARLLRQVTTLQVSLIHHAPENVLELPHEVRVISL